MNKRTVVIIFGFIIIGIICSSFFIIRKSNSSKFKNTALKKENTNNQQTLDNNVLNEISEEEKSLIETTDNNTDLEKNHEDNLENISETSNNNPETSTEAYSNNNLVSKSEITNNSSAPTIKENIPEYPTDISMLPKIGTIRMSVGDTYQLSIETSPSKVKNSSGTWSSSDTSVATVDSNGKVTGLRNGFCDIIFTSANGKKVTKDISVYYTVLGTKEFNRTIYNKNGITITANNFIYDMESIASPLYFTVTNNSGETISAYASTTQSGSYSDFGVNINGQKFINNSMFSISIANDLINDTTRKSYIAVYQDYFRMYQVKKINTMNFYITFLDENHHYKYSSDLITLNF